MEFSTLIFYCEKGWPEKHSFSLQLKHYWKWQGQLTTQNNLLLYETHMVIPLSMQQEIPQKLHDGHQGIQRCHLRVKTSVWWLRMSKQISDLIERCYICAHESIPRREPLNPSKLPDYPWQKLGLTCFIWRNLITYWYFSRFIEAIKLKSTTSRAIDNRSFAICILLLWHTWNHNQWQWSTISIQWI